ncbi:MAG: lysophospholipid acyltransferase family protein [Phycisphaeraceae bacterium]
MSDADEQMDEVDANGESEPARPVAPRSLPSAEVAQKLSFKKRCKIAVASFLGRVLIRTIGLTLRHQFLYKGQLYPQEIAHEYFDSFRDGGKPLLFGLWHGTCLPILYYWRGKGTCVITSRSADGQILSRILNGFGYMTVAGSSSRGGIQALINTLDVVRGGVDASIALDGPRGPLHVAKPGIILLAKLTGRPIVVVTACAKRYRRFRSWDRFRLPGLFTKVTFTTTDPIYVPNDADHDMIEAKRAELEQSLRRIQQEVDDFVQPKVKGYLGK